MANLGNFLDYLDDDTLELEGIPSKTYPDGKTYRIKSPDAKTGMRLAAMGDAVLRAATGHDIDPGTRKKLELDDGEERELMDEVMGDTKDEMIEDGVTWTHLRGILQYAFIYFAMGKEQADNAAQNGILAGKAPEPANRTERRKKPRTQQARQDSGGSSKPKAKPKPKTKK